MLSDLKTPIRTTLEVCGSWNRQEIEFIISYVNINQDVQGTYAEHQTTCTAIWKTPWKKLEAVRKDIARAVLMVEVRRERNK